MNHHWKKQFAIIYTGQAFSLFGSAAVQFAVIWWLTLQTNSAITLTVASIAAFLPTMLIGPFAGVWIDRYNRRTVMVAADGLVAFSSLILGVVFLLTDTPPIWLIYLILLLRGLGNTFHGPAMQAAIPLLVPSEMLTKAGGWGNLVNSISNMLGPVLGAFLMSFFSIASIMLVDILGAMLAIFSLLLIKIPNIPQRAEKVSFFTDIKLGFSTIQGNKPLMAVFIPMVLVNILFTPLGSLFPLLVRTHYMGEAWHNSIVEFFFAGGLLISSIVIGIWGGMRKRFLMISLSIALLGVASLISGLLPVEGFWIFVACSFVMGISGTLINVPLMAYAQETIPPDQLGKALSLLMSAMSLAMPIGLLIAGPISEKAGVDQWFFWSGVFILIVSVLCHVLTRRFNSTTPPIQLAANGVDTEQPNAPQAPR